VREANLEKGAYEMIVGEHPAGADVCSSSRAGHGLVKTKTQKPTRREAGGKDNKPSFPLLKSVVNRQGKATE
jgi:hypothetical protein